MSDKLRQFAELVLKEQLEHGNHGDLEYIRLAIEALKAGDDYNGWPNRETWAAHLWLANDEWCHHRVLAEIADKPTSRPETILKDWTEDLWDTVTKGRGEHQQKYCRMLEDIGSIWRVDWVTVAAALAASGLAKTGRLDGPI